MYAFLIFYHISRHTIPMLQRPILQEVILIVAMAMLIVFCIDKSRQNQRTRQTLYNCIYPVYGAVAFKAVMLLDSIIGFNFWGHVAGLLLCLVAMLAYWRFFKKQEDIKYNTLFRYVGWLVLAICAVMQTYFVVWTI